MGAPTSQASSLPRATRGKIRSVAHRFAGACAHDLSDVFALGVRYDDDDPTSGESLVVRLRPGRIDAIVVVGGPGRAIGFVGHRTPGESLCVLDDRGALRTTRGDVILDGVADIHDDGQRLLALQGDNIVDVATKATVARIAGAVSLRGGVVRTTRGVCDLDGNVLVGGVVDCAASSDGSLAWVRGRTLTIDGTAMPLASNTHALARMKGRWFVGSHQGGLSVVDAGAVVPLRPSLRAHQLKNVGGGLLIVSDLFVATSEDGVDFMSRDLAAFVRLADKLAA